MNILEFDDLQKAWEGINEFLFMECNKVDGTGGGLYGPEWISYDNHVVAKRGVVNPDFDFGYVLGYKIKKWTSLVNNYVDKHSLDIIRSEISHRVKRSAKSYNYAYHFSNKHGHGKDCLVSINFTKRITHAHPILVFSVRTSEVTKRLLFDFLLVQRIGEYIYGHNDFEVHLHAPSFYITAESFVIYNNVKRLHKLVPKVEHKFQQRVFDKLDYYLKHPDPESIKYKVNRRAAMQIVKDEDGHPISACKPMLAKDLVLYKETIKSYPKEVITKKQMRAHDKGSKK